MTAPAARTQEKGGRLDLAAPALALAAAVTSLALVGTGEDATAIWLLFVPVVVALAPLAVAPGRPRRTARLVTAALLLLWCLVAIASVGLFYLPALAASVAAAIRGRRH